MRIVDMKLLHYMKLLNLLTLTSEHLGAEIARRDFLVRVLLKLMGRFCVGRKLRVSVSAGFPKRIQYKKHKM